MTRREIRENIFKLVFCGEFHTSDELQGQVDAYLEALPEATEEERAYMTQKFNGIKDRITEIDAKINEVAKGLENGTYGKGRAGDSPACCL